MLEPTWKSGDIELYLGDCLEILPQLPAGSVDAVVTDPPYNVGINYSEKVNDRLSMDEYKRLIKVHIEHYQRLSNGNIALVLGAKRKILLSWWELLPGAELIIVRMGAVSDNRAKNLSLQFHPVLTTIESNVKARNLWEDIRWPGEGYFFNENRYGHPAMTPLKLARRLVSYFSNPGHVILDSFLGSGTTGVACVQTGRRFIGIEIDPNYFDIAVKRVTEAQLQMRLPI